MSAGEEARPLRVMLVDDQSERSVCVEETLCAAGFEVVARLPSAQGLLRQMAQHLPDVVLIDLQSPGRDVLESLAIANEHNPRPVVMFSAGDDPGFIGEAVDAGVTGYMLEGFSAERVKPVIDLAIAQFRNHQALRAQLDDARSRLSTQSVIEQAKQLLIRQRGISEDQAHRALRKLAMDSNQTLPDAARSVLRLLGSDPEEDAP